MIGFSNFATPSSSDDMLTPLVQDLAREMNGYARDIQTSYQEAILDELDEVRDHISRISPEVADLVELVYENKELKYVIRGSARAEELEYGTPSEAPRGLLRSAAARSAQSLPLRMNKAIRL